MSLFVFIFKQFAVIFIMDFPHIYECKISMIWRYNSIEYTMNVSPVLMSSRIHFENPIGPYVGSGRSRGQYSLRCLRIHMIYECGPVLVEHLGAYDTSECAIQKHGDTWNDDNPSEFKLLRRRSNRPEELYCKLSTSTLNRRLVIPFEWYMLS